MNLLTAEGLSKSYGIKKLFEGVSLSISEGEKIGLVGVNGAGKSTLLKALAGIEPADKGTITMAQNLQIEYLPQNPDFEQDLTILEQVFKGNSPAMQLIRDYQRILTQVESNPGDQALQRKLLQLGQQMDGAGAWHMESEAKTVLTRLGISDFSLKVSDLSGGQRKRVALAGALIRQSDLLILDEPTNHIDNDTVAWLEQYLNKRKGALLMITHDRYFLDRVVNSILELDRGSLYRYTGNYSMFLELKVEREEMLQASERKRQNLLRNELAWIRRGAKARTTKQKARIDRFEKLNEEKYEAAPGKVDISVAASRLGKKVLLLEHVTKSFDQHTLFKDFSYIFGKAERVGIIGPNGSGKTTLLNIIAGKVTPDSGTVEQGVTVKTGYFSQENEEMNGEVRVIEYIKEVAEFIPTASGEEISASQMLNRFLFPPSVQWTPIERLSGGEKRRLFLLRVLMGAPNLLLLDEPTNDLDIQTLTVLEDYLDDFPGTLVVVSHDRYFLDRTVDTLFVLGDGKITQFTGSYSDYMEYLQSIVPKTEEPKPKGSEDKRGYYQEKKKDRPLKFSYKEQKEFEQIDVVIAGAERELAEVTDKINQAGSDYELLQKLLAKKEQLENTLEELLERWTYLNELAEEIERSKQ